MTAPGDGSAFIDAATVRRLYATTDRLETRTSALKAAKVAGRNPAEVVCELVARYGAPEPRVLEVGPGRGGLTLRLTTLRPRALVVVDSSPSMLEATTVRIAPHPVVAIRADFHAMPLSDDAFDVAVGAFCLYHSRGPASVCAELARCVREGGSVVLSTKSVSSYRELDQIVAAAELDPLAEQRPSLYATFATENMRVVASSRLEVIDELVDTNVFRFAEPAHALQYLLTSPKYDMTDVTYGDRLEALRRVWPPGGLTMTSDVGYIVCRT